MENNREAYTGQQLLCQIQELDFALVELNLFLDTHPCDREALRAFREIREKRDALIAAYEEHCGPFIQTAGDAAGDNAWCWTQSPWPWEY